MSPEPYDKPPKQPPPREGVKIRSLGATWWGQRWIGALELFSRDYLNRLGRGRTYARAGRVHDLSVAPGKVTAKVTGSRTKPYTVTIAMDAFPDADWDIAVHAMAQEARFAAELLAGQMPHDIDAIFRKCKRSLFPRKSHDLQTDCSCPDWASPCKHVAATHYVLGEAFDRDPFLLFELRGRTREQVLDALSRLRSGEASAERDAPEANVAAGVPVIPEMAANYDAPSAATPMLRFNFDPPQSPAAILRSIPPPRAWSEEVPPAEFFAHLYQRAGDLARQMAGLEEPQRPQKKD
ncbi:MAG: SWIM zinc finger family protein [Steroidobacter sp.]